MISPLRMGRSWAVGALVIAACSGAGQLRDGDPTTNPCAHDTIFDGLQSGAPDAELATMSPAQRCELAAGLSRIPDPCDARLSLLAGFGPDVMGVCAQRKFVGQAAVKLAHAGYSADTIELEALALLGRLATPVVTFVLDHAPMLGTNRSKRVVVEFLDFECPHCKAASARVLALAGLEDVVVYIKHFPKNANHPYARHAALAAIAVHRQGLFWDYYKRVFAESLLTPEVIDRVVASTGADMKRYRDDMQSPALADELDRDIREGEAAGVQGTPSFFLEGASVKDIDELEDRLRQVTTK